MPADCFCSWEVKSGWCVFHGPKRPIENVNKTIFWWLFLDMKSEKKKLDSISWPSVQEHKRETPESVSSSSRWHPYVCYRDTQSKGEKIERKIIVSQYLSNRLHRLGDKSWHHFLSVRTHFGFVHSVFVWMSSGACADVKPQCVTEDDRVLQCHSFQWNLQKTQALG